MHANYPMLAPSTVESGTAGFGQSDSSPCDSRAVCHTFAVKGTVYIIPLSILVRLRYHCFRLGYFREEFAVVNRSFKSSMPSLCAIDAHVTCPIRIKSIRFYGSILQATPAIAEMPHRRRISTGARLDLGALFFSSFRSEAREHCQAWVRGGLRAATNQEARFCSLRRVKW